VSTIYLLPCSCGCKIPVDSRQAGEIISCSCGATLEVPTLLTLRTLELASVPIQPETQKANWNTGHRLILLGAVVVLAGIVIGILLFWFRPTDPLANFSVEGIKETSQKLSPSASWTFWKYCETGGLQKRKQPVELFYESEQSQQFVFWCLLALVLGTGLTLATAGLIIIRYRGKKPSLTK
jgi:hypothetical protein